MILWECLLKSNRREETDKFMTAETVTFSWCKGTPIFRSSRVWDIPCLTPWNEFCNNTRVEQEEGVRNKCWKSSSQKLSGKGWLSGLMIKILVLKPIIVSDKIHWAGNPTQTSSLSLGEKARALLKIKSSSWRVQFWYNWVPEQIKWSLQFKEQEMPVRAAITPQPARIH